MFDLIAIETCTGYFIFIVNPVQFNLAFFILNTCICKYLSKIFAYVNQVNHLMVDETVACDQ